MTEENLIKANALKKEIKSLEMFLFALGDGNGAVFSTSKISVKLIGRINLKCFRSFGIGSWNKEIILPKSIYQDIGNISKIDYAN